MNFADGAASDYPNAAAPMKGQTKVFNLGTYDLVNAGYPVTLQILDDDGYPTFPTIFNYTTCKLIYCQKHRSLLQCN